MADISDVQDALVDKIIALIYPDGVNNRCSVSDAGFVVSIYSGWPQPKSLDRDLAKGNAHVTVFGDDGERDTTRYNRARQKSIVPVSSLTMTIAGQTVTIGGTVSVPISCCIVVQNTPYVYTTVTGDTLATVAAALLALMIDDYPSASRSGAVITLPAYANLQTVVTGAQGTTLRNIKQQECRQMVTIWASSDEKRNAIARLLDAQLAADNFLDLPDNTRARFIYAGTRLVDSRERVGLYRRDLFYRVDYSTTITETAQQIVSSTATLAP